MIPETVFFVVVLIFGSSALYRGDECTIDNSKGKCIPIKQCPEAIKELKSGTYRQPCGFEGKNPLVCCEPNSALQESISQKKCREYATYIPEFQIFSIVGGTNTEPREFPHMAALGFTNGDQILWQCGGSLVSEHYILTAGHCLTHRTYGRVSRIRLGETSLPESSPTSPIPTTDYQIASIIPHPDYRPPSTYNDIALIRLARPAEFSPFVKPACLDSRPTKTGEHLEATGWGLTNQGGERSETLQKAEIEIYGGEECNRTYASISGSRRLRVGLIQGQFCAGGRNSNKDTCQGDSGGPVQIYNTNERIWSIVGVTSFGKICGESVPGVYSKVSYYLPWLENVIWPN